jgi:Ca-activated chloride channel family protein
MKPKILGVLAFVLVATGAAFGQGVIIPEPCRRCPPMPIPRPVQLPRVLKIQSVKVTTRIDSQIATTKVEQVFENDTPYRLEGSYFFPIPESASISDFAIYDGDKRMSGEVVERAKARQIYNEIVRKRIDPGLLEYAGKDLFEADVFPIEPRSTKRIDLTYTQVLKAEGGTVSYRYPLGSGRHMLSQPIERIAASVEVASLVDLKSIFSPSHKISVSRDGERRANLSFEGSGQEAQKDFQLYYSLSDKDFGLSLLTYREPGKDGYFLMLVSPKTGIGEKERIAKDVVFVLDTSGSMSGEKLNGAKAALRFGVESLDDRDRFNIISFSGEEHLMKAALVEANKAARHDGLAFIENLRAEGGTNINDALVTALKQFQAADRPAMIVFLTDGLPTVGTTDMGQIFKNVAEANRAQVRLFSFGVGYDVNTNLLDKLSADNGGVSDYIEPGEDLEIKVSNFFSKVNYPVLSDLRLDMGGVEAEMLYPKTLPDLFKGSQLTIVGRYKNVVNAAPMRLMGKIGPREETISFGARNFPSEKKDNEFLPRLWATRRIGYLLEQIRLNGRNRELVDEIVALGTRYGIVTQYTSFLVTEDEKDLARRDLRGANGAPLHNNLALAAIPAPSSSGPGGGSGTGTGRGYDRIADMQAGSANRMPSPPAEATGKVAVAQSRAEKSLAETVEVSATEYLTNVRTAGGKTFLLKDGVWVDTEYKDEATLLVLQLKFGSDEFFSLIDKQPKLAEIFALGQKVIVLFEGKVYRVE